MRKINDPFREPLREKQFVPLPKHHLNLSPFPTKDYVTWCCVGECEGRGREAMVCTHLIFHAISVLNISLRYDLS